ncbi:corrinoid protein [Syntrophothermus sp.]|uniref:corrinoid protein n=1 Tax=Syntrophothermus sp. TaxID=2736299 RepID=UPI00339065D8
MLLIGERELLARLADAVVQMEVENTVALCRMCVDLNYDLVRAVEQGLRAGMSRAGLLFERGEYFLPELLMCSEAFYAGMEIIRSYIERQPGQISGKILIGVVENDVHDIGKNVVRTMLECSGFEVFDLGKNVPPRAFVEKARELQVDVIALSTLMTTTMIKMHDVLTCLTENGVRDNFKVVVGGSPVSAGFAKRIGADGYAEDAVEAVRVIRQLLKRDQRL